MSDGGACEWRFYVEDMIPFCERVTQYTQGLDAGRFVTDRLRYDATLGNLELIGEAASQIPEAVRSAHPEIPWRLVIATRNRLIHGYLGIDNDTLLSIIRDDIPPLRIALRAMRAAA